VISSEGIVGQDRYAALGVAFGHVEGEAEDPFLSVPRTLPDPSSPNTLLSSTEKRIASGPPGRSVG